MLQTRRARICPGRLLFAVLFVLSVINSAFSASLDCGSFTEIDGTKFKFQSLAGEQKVTGTEETPPTKNSLDLRFDVCADLPKNKETSDAEQCPSDTRACLVKTNQKDKENSRVIAVIPVAQTKSLDPSYLKLDAMSGVSIQLHGLPYPPNTPYSIPQSLNLTILCTKSDLQPKFVQYVNGVVSVEWEHSAGCPTKDTDEDDGKKDDGKKDDGHSGESRGSGISWFFLLLLIAFLAYFVLGAYYNYNNFGATGWDLVPHRDFWRDVPYLLRDFGEHLCTTLRPGRQTSRRGYMAV